MQTLPLQLRLRLRQIALTPIIIGLLIVTTGCAGTATQPSANAAADTHGDPLQSVNRAILKFNFAADRVALKPLATAYVRLPQPVRNGVRNFFSNLWLPSTILNDLLQGKFAAAGRDTGRFLINTLVGAGGLMDAAREFGLPHHREDFGQTLAVWKVPPGPYLVLPFFGPSNVRDSVSLFQPVADADLVTHLDSPQAWYARGVRVVDARAGWLDLDEVLALQPDRYFFLREGYRQQRAQLIHDGNPPPDLNDGDDVQLWDELLESEDAE